MELLGDMGHVKSHFWSVWRQCWHRCNIVARFTSNIPYAWKSVWTHPMELLGDVGLEESNFGPFGDSVSFDGR